LIEECNFALAVTYNLIPNAEPFPVDIAFIIVAEPGDLISFRLTPIYN
jgi:hypothetical protein